MVLVASSHRILAEAVTLRSYEQRTQLQTLAGVDLP
jgi:hypothetical protein